MQMPEEFRLAAVSEREDPQDAWVSNRYDHLDDVPPGGIVGTSSLRREAQLRARYPYLAVSPLRGNLDTRLRKLDEGQFDAIILAAAGLRRLGLAGRIRSVLPPELFLPAAGQGALGIEISTARHDVAAWVAPLHHMATARCVESERSLALTLQGTCELPLAAYATGCGEVIWLRGLIAQQDGSRVLCAEAQGTDPKTLGQRVAADLLDQGAGDILSEARR